MATFRRVCRVALLASAVAAGDAVAQPTTATISGAVYDQQQAALPGATVTARNLETGHLRTVVSDRTGNLHLVGLPPGRYELTIELAGFVTWIQSDLSLSLGQEAEFTATLKIASLKEDVQVVAPTFGELSKTTLGRTFTTKEIEELPVAARNFVSLALLTPGILTDHSAARATTTAIISAGQTRRNNSFLLDGLSLDEHSFGNTRGGLSLEAIREFMVLSNNFSAEYGQAAGAFPARAGHDRQDRRSRLQRRRGSGGGPRSARDDPASHHASMFIGL